MNKSYPTKTQPHNPSHWTSERILNRTLETIAPLPSQEGYTRYLLTPEYKAFDKLYDIWMQRHLVSALQAVMGYIQEKHGVCRVRLEAKHLPPQRIR